MRLEEDILQPVNLEELIRLIEIYKKHVPSKVLFYYHLKNRLNWIKERKFKSSRCCIQIYKPKNGNLESGTFFSISDEADCIIVFCTLNENLEELNECFNKTKRINWKVPLFFEPIMKNQSKMIYDRLKEDVTSKEYPCCYFWLPKTVAGQIQVTDVPENVYLAPLKIENTETICTIYPHRYEGIIPYVENIIELNGGIGLYSKSTGSLLSWVLRNEHGGIGTLQTIASELRKGYGKIVVKAMTRRIADSNDDVSVFILKDNFKSQKLFLSLGFIKVGECTGFLFQNSNK